MIGRSEEKLKIIVGNRDKKVFKCTKSNNENENKINKQSISASFGKFLILPIEQIVFKS